MGARRAFSQDVGGAESRSDITAGEKKNLADGFQPIGAKAARAILWLKKKKSEPCVAIGG